MIRACGWHNTPVASQDYIDPDSFHDDDNYVEPEEDPTISKEVLVLDRQIYKQKAQQWCQWSAYLYP